MIALGVGFSSRCTAADLNALVDAVLAASGSDPATARYLATTERKRGTGLLEAVAACTGLHAVYIDDAALQAWQTDTRHHSAAAATAVGVGSVAEAAALAALGAGAQLLVPRRSATAATCAAAIHDGRTTV